MTKINLAKKSYEPIPGVSAEFYNMGKLGLVPAGEFPLDFVIGGAIAEILNLNINDFPRLTMLSFPGIFSGNSFN